jgi:hypothetical protein
MMTTVEFLMMVADLPYVRVLTVASTCVTCYFDECYDERHDLTDEEQEHFDDLYDLMIVHGVRLTDSMLYLVDSTDCSDSWDD